MRGRRRRANCSRLHQRHRGGGPPIRSNIVSSAANITASSGSTPCNARWDVSGAAGSPNEDKSHPKWRPNLFPAPPPSLSPSPPSVLSRSLPAAALPPPSLPLSFSLALLLSLSTVRINLAAASLHFPSARQGQEGVTGTILIDRGILIALAWEIFCASSHGWEHSISTYFDLCFFKHVFLGFENYSIYNDPFEMKRSIRTLP